IKNLYPMKLAERIYLAQVNASILKSQISNLKSIDATARKIGCHRSACDRQPKRVKKCLANH
ncbi:MULTISPECIES: hypothetical protein, partial [unclassified Microcoleus]|uniref:hypothetical protein n=1 Tax=unclassified Microcoleus TaxID=2642155 RepID=UPI002FD33924